MSVPSHDSIDALNKQIKIQDEEKVTKIWINKSSEQKLVLDLNSGAKEHAILVDKTKPINLNALGLSILESIITKEQQDLIQCANSYKCAGRDWYFFLYDLVALAWFLAKLSSRFDKLRKIVPTDTELLHNRIHAQLASHYQDLGYNPGFEKQNSKKRIPDLQIDGIDIEIKTILSPVQNMQKSFIEFSKSFRNSHDSALEQIDSGVPIIGMWSQNMNNILKDYLRGQYSNTIPSIEKDTTILVLEGNKVFEDYYCKIPSNQAKDLIRRFAETDYVKYQYSYLGNISRAGFPHGRQSAPGSTVMYYRNFG